MLNRARAMDEAIGWLIRRRDPDFADWEGLTDWLEADPANAEAYAQLAADDQAIADRAAMESIVDRARHPDHPAERTSGGRRGMIAGLAMLAASMLVVAGIFQFSPDRSIYQIETPPGVQRTVMTASGTVLRLNGSTSVRLDRDDPRYAEVTSGEVLFEVVHDESRPFLVEVGGAQLHDMGTSFNVLREPGVTEVGVSDGAVRYWAGGETVDLAPGKQLRATDGELTLMVSDVDPAAVGSWARRRLVYYQAPLSVVARDIARSIGEPVQADPRSAALPITAVIKIPQDPEQLPPHLESLLGITVMRSKDGWILTERH